MLAHFLDWLLGPYPCVSYDGIHVRHSTARTAARYAASGGGQLHWHYRRERT